jgi:hypothetical protein
MIRGYMRRTFICDSGSMSEIVKVLIVSCVFFIAPAWAQTNTDVSGEYYDWQKKHITLDWPPDPIFQDDVVLVTCH